MSEYKFFNEKIRYSDDVSTNPISEVLIFRFIN